MDRRAFLKSSMLLGTFAATSSGFADEIAANAAGCGKMALYHDKPFEKLRVGVIGLGRGHVAFANLPVIPNCEVTAICDLNAKRILDAKRTIRRVGQMKEPKVYTGGPEEWKKLCDDPEVDLVWNATPWQLHVPISLYAMNAGKHVAVEVPAAFTVKECWQLVETSERLERHCMMLENCCYGETEMLALNLCRQGKFGRLTHGEGAYIHDLRGYNYATWDEKTGKAWDIPGGAYWDHWRLKWNMKHKGNQYPTHGLGPICQYMDINRGDQFDYLVSLENNPGQFKEYAYNNWASNRKRWDFPVEMGDMNTTLIKTKKGRSIMIQHDISTPRPYSRINTITGSKGILMDYPLRLGWIKRQTDSLHRFFDEKKTEEVRKAYMHPLWKDAGAAAAKQGGHGGMDYLMTLRLAACLLEGKPLDQNVYDLAEWSCLCELTEKSVRSGSMPQKIPDFTRGAWKKTPSLGIESVDPKWIMKV